MVVVSLDFDDTLIESEKLKREVLLEIVNAFEGGLEALATIETDARNANAKVTRHTIFRDFALRVNSGVSAEDLAAQYTERVEALLKDANEVPGAELLLRHLKQHDVRVFVNSATPQEPLEALVKARGWRTLVTDVLGAPNLGGDKVDNLRVLADHEPPNRVVHVGDGDNDASAAARFGCKFISVGPVRRNAALANVSDMHEAAVAISAFCGIPPPPPPAADATAKN